MGLRAATWRLGLLVVLLWAAVASHAAAADTSQQDCESTDAVRSVRGCTALLARGSALPSKLRAAILANRGESWLTQKDPVAALKDGEAAVAADPTLARAHALVGAALAATGKHPEAITSYSQALSLDRSDIATRQARARSYVAIGDRDKARTDLDECVRIRFGKAQPLVERGRFFLDLGELVLAKADFDKAVDYDKKDARAYYWRARLQMRMGQLDAAALDLDAAIFLDPHPVVALMARADLRQQAGDAPGAREDLVRAADGDPLVPDVIEARQRLAKIGGPLPGLPTAEIKPADVAAKSRPAGEVKAVGMGRVLRIVTPVADTTFGRPDMRIDYEIDPIPGVSIAAIDVLIDGQKIVNRGAVRVQTGASVAMRGQVSVNLPRRDVDVTLVARSGDLASEPATVHLVWRDTSDIAIDPLLRPNLYVLAVGISDYADPALKLGLAAKDASEFADALTRQEGRLYAKVYVKVMTNQEATRVNIIRGLSWLRSQVTSRDIAMVFFAGHGLTTGDSFWFLPTDVQQDDLAVSAISNDNLRTALKDLPSKTILFIDACHAGKAINVASLTRGVSDIKTLVTELSSTENSVVVYASSTGRELSQERPEWGHGAFTLALIEAIDGGKAELFGRGDITLKQVDAYVVQRVKALTDGQQHPQMRGSDSFTDFSIATPR